MKKLIRMLILALVILGITGCSTIKGLYLAQLFDDQEEQSHQTILHGAAKDGQGREGRRQVGPGTSIADATKALKRMEAAYGDLEKFGHKQSRFRHRGSFKRLPDLQTGCPALNGDGDVGDPATQIRAALEAYNTTMDELVTAACPTK